jgi:hypothetical protein
VSRGRRGRAGWPALALVVAATAGSARAAAETPSDPVQPPGPTPEPLAPRADAPAPTARDANRAAVCLVFEGPWSAALTSLVEADLRTAFGRREAVVCARDALPATREAAALLTLRLESESFDKVSLSLDPRDRPALERALNLTPFPADGRVLALIVAADELLQASREQPTVTAAPPSPVQVVPERAPTVVRSGPSAPTEPRQSIAVGFALEHYGGGQTQLGPDLTWRLRFARTLYVTVAGQTRRGLVADGTNGTVSSRLLGGRLALGAGLFAPRLSLTADLGVRGGRIWFEGEPAAGSGAIGDTAVAWLAYTDAVLAVELRVAGWFALRLAGSVGAPLLAQAAAEGTRDVTAASGVALGAQAAALVVF